MFYAPHTCSFATHIALEDDGVDPARIPKVIEHRSRISERAAVRKAIADELRG